MSHPVRPRRFHPSCCLALQNTNELSPLRTGVDSMPLANSRDLSDAQWEILDDLIPKPKIRMDGRGRPWKERRAVLNGVLWVLRMGAPWADVPDRLSVLSDLPQPISAVDSLWSDERSSRISGPRSQNPVRTRPRVHHDLCNSGSLKSSGVPVIHWRQKGSEFSQSPAELQLTWGPQSSNLAHKSPLTSVQ
jgi:hypothetical protein